MSPLVLIPKGNLMLIKLLFAFIILLISISLGLELKKDAGYVLIIFNHWSIETSLWVALGFLLLSFCLLHGFFMGLHGLKKLPFYFQRWRKEEAHKEAESLSCQGLIEYNQGDWSKAKSHFIKAAPKLDKPLFNYLMAAKAAQALNDNSLRDHYLKLAQEKIPEAHLSIKLTKVELLLETKQWDEALILLKQLAALNPNHPYLLTKLLELYQQQELWTDLLELIPKIKKKRILSPERLSFLEHQAFLQTLKKLIQEAIEEPITKLIAELPKNLRGDPEILSLYCDFLVKKAHFQQAETLLATELLKAYDDNLIDRYSKLKVNKRQLSLAESLSKKHPNSATLYLGLARLSLNQELWGKAQAYFVKSLELKPQAITYAEFGHLLERLGKIKEASEAYRKGLELGLMKDAF